MIKPWLFEFLPELGSPSTEPNAADVTALFGRYLDLWVRDEALGFEGIFFSEHHLGRSYSPSPNLLIAALGPRTKKLRLGVMGVVLPYYHPARVVEEIGMLDHLTGGRLEIGTAIGVPQELSRLNMTMAEARERNDEIVAFLDAALTNRIVSYRGKYFSFSNVRLLPRPLQQPFPPRWTTVISADSARRAARRRIKISTGFNATPLIKKIFDAYREEADALGFAAGPAQGGCTNHHRAMSCRWRWTFPDCAQLECAGRRSGASSRPVRSRGHSLTAQGVNIHHGRCFHCV